MAFELPSLPYEIDALEPFISKQTLEYHYGKHHQTYVNNLNKLIASTPFEDQTLEEIIVSSEGGIFNNAAQVWNHTFYWNCLMPKGGGVPSGVLLITIEKKFGSFDIFKEKFTAAAASLFGSGWVWLVKKPDGEIDILQEINAGNPLTKGYTPLLTCDVWEHAYYLDRQNKRPEYIDAFWKILDWRKIEARF